MGLVADVATLGHEADVLVDGLLDRSLELLEALVAMGAFVHRDFEAANHVEHRDVVEAIHAPGDGELDAADDGIVPGVGQTHPTVHERGHVDLVVEHLRHAVTQTNHLARLMIEVVRRTREHAQRQVGLRQARVLLNVKQETGELVGGVVPLVIDATDHEVEAGGEARERLGALGRAHEDDRVRLEVEALEKLADGGGVHTFGNAGLVVGPKVLVHATERDGARIRLMLERHLDEPDELQRVAEVAGGLGSDVREYVGHGEKLDRARGRHGRREPAALALISAHVGDGRLDADDGSLVEVVLGMFGGPTARLGGNVAQTARENGWQVGDDMSLALVGLGNGEDASLLRLGSPLGEVRAVPVVERAARPVGIQPVAEGVFVGLAHLEGVLRTRGKEVELVENPIGRHFRREDPRTWRPRTVADEKVVVVNHDPVVLEDVSERMGTAHDDGQPLRPPPALGVEEGALEVDLARTHEEGVPNRLGSRGEHGAYASSG